MKPVLSIVTITHMDPEGLKATIESLRPLQEEGVRWEHVVVDGSLRENASVIRSIPDDWPLNHIPSPPKGIYSAINSGIENAHGEMVQLLHGGDRLRNAKILLRLVREMEEDREIDVYSAGAALYRGKKFKFVHPSPSGWIRGLVGMNRFCHQAMVYRRGPLVKLGPFLADFPLASDYEHHFRCYLQGMRLKRDADAIVDFDTGGASSNVRQAMAEFRAVQLSLKDRLPAALNVANTVVWWFEEKRIRMAKTIGNSPLGEIIRSAWHAWKRRKG